MRAHLPHNCFLCLLKQRSAYKRERLLKRPTKDKHTQTSLRIIINCLFLTYFWLSKTHLSNPHPPLLAIGSICRAPYHPSGSRRDMWTIPDICLQHNQRCWWRKNLSCGEIFPCDRLSCGEVSPHGKCSVGDMSPHGK